MSGIKGWERAVPMKRPDNLCATTFTQKPFIPSYEKSYCKPDMTLMVTMEYRRMWFEERAAWQVDAYPKRKKRSSSANFEQKWREKQKDKVKVKGKEGDGESKAGRKKRKKYQNCGPKIDTGRGYVGCLSKGNLPCQDKAIPVKENSLTGNSSSQGCLTTEKEEKMAAKNQPEGNLTSQGGGDLADKSAEVLNQQAQGNELVPQCTRCKTFHAQRARCPTTVLCKEKAFKDRIMRDTC